MLVSIALRIQQVGNSYFTPLVVLFSLAGVATHLGALTGAVTGYFSWTMQVICELALTHTLVQNQQQVMVSRITCFEHNAIARLEIALYILNFLKYMEV
jgi:hypothetical protein